MCSGSAVMHGPVVMVAVFFTLVVSAGRRLGCEGDLHRVAGGQGDVDGQGLGVPVTVAVQVSVAAIVVQFTVVATQGQVGGEGVSEDRRALPEPVFFTVIV